MMTDCQSLAFKETIDLVFYKMVNIMNGIKAVLSMIMLASISTYSVADVGNKDGVDEYEKRLIVRGSIPLSIVAPRGAGLGSLSKDGLARKQLEREHVISHLGALYINPALDKGVVDTPWGACRFKYKLYATDAGVIKAACPSRLGNGVGYYGKDENLNMQLSIRTSKGYLITAKF